jgi:hypothetical protein
VSRRIITKSWTVIDRKIRHLLRYPRKLFIFTLPAYVAFTLIVWWALLSWAKGTLAEAIYFVTGAIILWYTVETHAMRRETTRQTELAVKPAVLARIEDNPHALILRNIGNGPALYVMVEDIEFDTGGRAGVPDHVVTFATTDVIEAKTEVPATVHLGRQTGQGTKPLFDYLSALDRRYQKKLDLPVVIRYQDLYGGLHRTRLEMGKSGTRFIRFESGGSR